MIKLKYLLFESFGNFKSGQWIHFTDVDYIRPRESGQASVSNDPLGIYLFPEKIELPTLLKHYWKQKKNKIYVSISSSIKLLDLSKLNNEDLKKFDIKVSQIKSGQDEFLKMYHRNTSSASIAWRILRDRNDSKSFTKLLLRSGYTAVFDDIGAIMPKEPQLIILNPDDVTIEKIVPNDLV